MARMWTEQLDPERHVDHMATTHIGGLPPEPPCDRLIERQVFFVAVCGFTFQFHSLEQIERALSHFERKIHPTSAQPGVTLEHYWQRWYERLPQWLFEEPKRVRVVAALRQALRHFGRAFEV
jgi:hypothetical protein